MQILSWAELPQSKPDGFASSLGEGAFGMAGKFATKPQSLRACSLPLGGAVAQRLRGCKSAEPEKTVKRFSRRTGVNLQFFPVEPTSLGSSRACSPWPVAGWVESRGREGGVGTPLPASGPAERLCTLKTSRKSPRGAQCTFPVLFWCQKRTSPALTSPHRTARTPVR